jgi:hypothetical protein
MLQLIGLRFGPGVYIPQNTQLQFASTSITTLLHPQARKSEMSPDRKRGNEFWRILCAVQQ